MQGKPKECLSPLLVASSYPRRGKFQGKLQPKLEAFDVIVIAPPAVLTHAQPAPVFYTKITYTTGSWVIMPLSPRRRDSYFLEQLRSKGNLASLFPRVDIGFPAEE